MKFLVIIPLYQPCPFKVSRLCAFFASCNIDVLFYINSLCKELILDIVSSYRSGFTVLGNGENDGTAKAYNAAISYLLSTNEYTHLCIFDQDSEPASDFFFVLNSLDQQFLSSNIICTFDNRNIHKSRCLLNSLYTYSFLYQSKASGMVIPRRLFELGHLFCESLFVDYVDWLFCWQAASYKFPVIEVRRLNINRHILGDPHSLLGIIFCNFPSSSRRRIQTKSALYLLKNYVLFRNAPFSSILKISLRPAINSILDGLQKFGLLVPRPK